MKPENRPETFAGRIGVLGAGAIGCYYGARLAQSGADVHFLMRSDYGAVRERGLVIHSIQGDFELRPNIHPTAEALGPCDLIVIGLKSTDNAALPALLAPTLHSETLVLNLQNGLGNDDAIARMMIEAAGDSQAGARLIGAAAFICSTRSAPGVVNHTAEGWLHIADFRGEGSAGGARPATAQIAAMFNAAGVRCEVKASLAQLRWEKLIWNVAFNGLGVAAGRADTAIIMADDVLRESAIGLMREVIAAARADGVVIEESIIEHRLDQTRRMGAYRTSMQIDYENGRPLEVEAILGEPLRRAQRAGIPVPRMELLYGLVRRAGAMRVV